MKNIRGILPKLIRRLSIFIFLFIIFCFSANKTFAQKNVKAWYQNGQVWVIWKLAEPIPETYAIYKSEKPFKNIKNAKLVGRLFKEDWENIQLKINANDSLLTQTIPSGDRGTYTLNLNEGLFVETVLESGSAYYAVVPWGDIKVKDENRTDVIHYRFSLNEPPLCYPQHRGLSPGKYPYTIYSMWVDGRQNENAGRPDFPVMANMYANGIPHIFIVSEPIGVQAQELLPVTLFLHGGHGFAKQSFPDSRPEINLNITNSLLVAHNDKLVRRLKDGTYRTNENTWFFGWNKAFNRFEGENPNPDDTIINYTQRRLIWINDWLIKHMNVDPDRISVMGHSMGSAGTNALMKVYPDKIAAAVEFNNGFETTEFTRDVFGGLDMNLITNVKNLKGDNVRWNDLWDLTTNVSSSRDFPVIRIYNGKNDQRGVMSWDSVVVANYKKADSIGFGGQTFWDGRMHGLQMWHDSHWSEGPDPQKQTKRDEPQYLVRYSSANSFPAFYNLRNAAKPFNAGNGQPDDGDTWGTWGGYHDWDTSIIDTPQRWEAIIYLTGKYLNLVDESPFDSLQSDLCIRKPQKFLPATGSQISWKLIDESTKDVLKSGKVIVADDGLVSLKGIMVYKYPKKVRIVFEDFSKQNMTSVQGEVPEPDYSDLSYGPYPRNVMDIWKADSENPTPIVIYIHGGGFASGDKVQGQRRINREFLLRCLDNGVSYASINYRFINTTRIDTILLDIARAIQFIRYKSEELNIDKNKLAAFGGSAGGGAAIWLAFHDDLADPDNEDPVLRESTRLTVVGHIISQATYDFSKWDEVVGIDKEKTGNEQNLSLYQIPDMSWYDSTQIVELRKNLDMISMIDKGDPPVYFYNPNSLKDPETTGEIAHHPKHAIFLSNVYRKQGLDYALVLADTPKEKRTDMLDFFFRYLFDSRDLKK
jgi:predicted esterase